MLLTKKRKKILTKLILIIATLGLLFSMILPLLYAL